MLTDPQSLIDDLDAALADAGEDVTLRRLRGTPQVATDVVCRAVLRGYADRELVGGMITEQDQHFILSPTQINAAGWPGAAADTNTTADQRVPINGDRMLTTRGWMTVMTAGGFYDQNVLVRIEGRVRGQ
jgi:hypothetical protein